MANRVLATERTVLAMTAIRLHHRRYGWQVSTQSGTLIGEIQGSEAVVRNSSRDCSATAAGHCVFVASATVG